MKLEKIPSDVTVKVSLTNEELDRLRDQIKALSAKYRQCTAISEVGFLFDLTCTFYKKATGHSAWE